MEPYQSVTDPDYFRGVLLNLIGPKANLSVRFGNQGDGHSPNYQTQDGEKIRRYSGRSHQLFHDNPLATFEDAHLSSGQFTYEEVQQLLKACLGAGK